MATINVISYAPAVSYANLNTVHLKCSLCLSIYTYITSGDSHRFMHYSNSTFRQGTWNMMSVFSKTNESLFTPFNQESKDGL